MSSGGGMGVENTNAAGIDSMLKILLRLLKGIALEKQSSDIKNSNDSTKESGELASLGAVWRLRCRPATKRSLATKESSPRRVGEPADPQLRMTPRGARTKPHVTFAHRCTRLMRTAGRLACTARALMTSDAPRSPSTTPRATSRWARLLARLRGVPLSCAWPRFGIAVVQRTADPQWYSFVRTLVGS